MSGNLRDLLQIIKVANDTFMIEDPNPFHVDKLYILPIGPVKYHK